MGKTKNTLNNKVQVMTNEPNNVHPGQATPGSDG